MRGFVLFLSFILAANQLESQVASTAPNVANGYISSTGYTNSYFGFHLPTLPRMLLKGPGTKGPIDILFTGQQFEQQAMTILMVSVDTSTNMDGKHVKISGRDFYLKTDKKHSPAGENYTAAYRTKLGDYTLLIMAASYSKPDFERLKTCVESMTFFDPAASRDQAGSDAVPVGAPASPPPMTN